jgi:branched-chain amino acid aminotransferase
MPSPLAYFNGQFVTFSDAGLPLHDAGFVSGATIVDNARTFRHKLFRWQDHLTRFRNDCKACFVPFEMTDEQLTEVAAELVEKNAKLLPPGGELQLVTFATPGPLGFYRGESANGPATLGMVTYPLPFERYRRFFTEGVSLAVAGIQSSNPADLLAPRVKHRSRLLWHIAEQAINDPQGSCYNPGAVPVVLNQQGVGDTAIGCVLAVVEDTVIRPIPGTVLESISAKVVGKLCRQIGLRCEKTLLDLRENNVPDDAPDELTASKRISEFMLAGTGFCLAPVRRFSRGSQVRNYNCPGPVYRKLLAAWSELVNVDIAKQFIGGNSRS